MSVNHSGGMFSTIYCVKEFPYHFAYCVGDAKALIIDKSHNDAAKYSLVIC